MIQPVLVSLLPVVLLIAAGYLAGRAGWVKPASIKDLSNLVFLLLTPALLFRTMSQVRVEELNFMPVAAYFIGVVLIFVGTLLVYGFNRRAAVLALAGTFSNTLMIGVPLVSLMYGPQGLITLFTLISVHSLILLTSATVVLEMAQAHEQRQGQITGGGTPRHMGLTVLTAIKNSILHPIPMPIMAGLLFAQTGLALPVFIDKPLELLGSAFAPVALVLVGITLFYTPIGKNWRPALTLATAKNLIHPLLVFGLCHFLGVTGLPKTVMVVASALPIGANVFIFSQRYKVAEELTTAAVAVSTVLALGTLTLVLLLVGRFA